MIPFLIVLVTLTPAIKAPENSKTAAMIIAYLMLIAPDPTDVPIALATSFAPIPQVMQRPSTIASIMNTEPKSKSM